MNKLSAFRSCECFLNLTGGISHDLCFIGFGCFQFCRNLSVKHDVHTVCDGKQLRVFSGSVEYAVPTAGNITDQMEYILLGTNINALGRFVENIQIAVSRHPFGDGHLLLIAA